jgi:hypothetical protein
MATLIVQQCSAEQEVCVRLAGPCLELGHQEYLISLEKKEGQIRP